MGAVYRSVGNETGAVALLQAVTTVSIGDSEIRHQSDPTHLTTICSTLPILLVPSPSLLVVSGGPQRQKSLTLLMYAFWQLLVCEDDVPQAFVPYWPSSDEDGRFDASYVAVYCARAGAARSRAGRKYDMVLFWFVDVGVRAEIIGERPILESLV